MDPTTKAEARAIVKRIREALRYAETAIRDGSALDLQDEVNEINGSAAQLQEYADHIFNDDGQG